MTKINCSECGKDFSSEVASCPYCGEPHNNITRPVGMLLGLGIFLSPVIFAWFTLQSGRSLRSRVIAFSWLLAILVLVLGTQLE